EEIENEEDELDIDGIEELESEYQAVIKKIEKLEPALAEANKITSNLIKNYKDIKNKKQTKKQKKLIDTIKIFSAKIGPAKQELTILKDNQKNIQSTLGKIQNLRKEIETTQSEIQRINREIQTSEQKAKVVVKGDAYPGTVIQGTNSCIEIFDKQPSVQFEEIHIFNENNMPERQIESKSL
ncbi:hypothetical protein MHK_002030, partial [Candidatus Magnetomorum sp. HK-1]